MVRIKICGITRAEDALAAVMYGADALGFVFHPTSPRYIEPERAGEIIRDLPPFVTAVGVFVDAPQKDIEHAACASGITVAQLHGRERPEDCAIARLRVIKAVRLRSVADLAALRDYRVPAFLLDSYSPHCAGGTGLTCDWQLALAAGEFGRVILAGGLTPENVQEAIRIVVPYGVDVSSGVESEPGVKNHDKIRRFIENARRTVR